MPGPIRTAKKFSEFESNNKLAEALIATYPEVSWGEKHRSLGNKIGDLDKGVTTWWRNNPDKASCLAELLELSLEDLGLHEKSASTSFYFLEFPELPPLDFKRDEIWQIAYEELDPQQISPGAIDRKPKMEFWLERQATLDWRQPTSFDWLRVSDDLHRRLLSRKLSTSGRYEVVFTETLAAAATRLLNPKPVIVVVEQDGGSEDLSALAERPRDAGILVIAPFMLPPREATSSAESLGWEAITIKGKEGRIFDLSAKHWSGLDAVKRWKLKNLPNWRERLLAWVERRLSRHGCDTFFSAQAIEEWLKSFDPHGLWFCSTADVMQLCHVVHRNSEKLLPKPNDPEAGARLTRMLFEREPVATVYLIEQLACSRWQSCYLWEGGLSLKEWLDISGRTGANVSRADLEEIVTAKTIVERKGVADRIATLLDKGNPVALMETGLLKEIRRDEFDFQHPTFARLIIRDSLIDQIVNGSLGAWALDCFDSSRRLLIDAALDAVPMASLIKTAHRLTNEPENSAASLAAAEALFISIGKRIARQENIPIDLYPVAQKVIRHLDISDDSNQINPWTRPMETTDDELAWICACWSWSLLPEAEINGVPVGLFPGWAKDISEFPYWLYVLEPENKANSDDLSLAFRAFWRVLVEWTKEVDTPAETWPPVILLAFLQKAARGGLSAQSAWWNKVVGQKWAEDLLLESCEEIGKDASLRLWPSFVRAEQEATLPSTEENQKPKLFYFQLSRIRIWLLKHLKPAEVLRGLDKDDLVYLAHRPETVPPEVRPDLLLAVKGALQASDYLDAMDFFERFGFHAASALEAFLEDDAVVYTVAQLLWQWNADRALKLLSDKKTVTINVRNALYWGCTEQHFPAACESLANDSEVFDYEERQRWIRKYLPNAGRHAEHALELLKAR